METSCLLDLFISLQHSKGPSGLLNADVLLRNGSFAHCTASCGWIVFVDRNPSTDYWQTKMTSIRRRFSRCSTIAYKTRSSRLKPACLPMPMSRWQAVRVLSTRIASRTRPITKVWTVLSFIRFLSFLYCCGHCCCLSVIMICQHSQGSQQINSGTWVGGLVAW